jgi:hypothetical protein
MGLCCEQCFKSKITCTETDKIVLNIPAPAAGTYVIILTSSTGKKYSYEYIYVAGDFEIDPAQFPSGLLNLHGGNFTLEIHKDTLDGELLNLQLADNYSCVELELFSANYDKLTIGV